MLSQRSANNVLVKSRLYMSDSVYGLLGNAPKVDDAIRLSAVESSELC